MNRQTSLLRGYDHWRERFSGGAPSYPGTAYTLLHSLSHALMAEIALDSGYPASSLKERIYALSDARSGGDSHQMWNLDLHSDAWRPGHTGWACRCRIAILKHSAKCARSADDLLERPGLRGP